MGDELWVVFFYSCSYTSTEILKHGKQPESFVSVWPKKIVVSLQEMHFGTQGATLKCWI